MRQEKTIEWFLRISLSVGFLSAVADRFGFWNKDLSAWGNWEAFAKYTSTLLPFLTYNLASIIGGIATFLEIVFAIALLTTFKSQLIAKCSGFLLLGFALSMSIAINCKAPLDYSVFTASAGAFALSILIKKNSEKTFE